MAIQLKKGQKLNLTKGTGLKLAEVGLGWDVNRYDGSQEFDLDAVVFECDANMRCIDENHFVFYGLKKGPDDPIVDPEGAVKHSGDNRTGEGDGDDETITIDFQKINPKVEHLVIGVTIYEAKERNQNFGMVENAYVRVTNKENGEVIARYDLSEDYSIQTAIIFVDIYKKDGEWKINAIGEGYEKELADFCREYGLEVG